MSTRDPRLGQQWATRMAFLVAGIGFSTLAPLVPTVKARFSLDESSLGLLLLCVGLGSLGVMPFGGALAARFGCRKVIVASAIALALSLPGIILATSIPLLAISLLLMGAGGGTLDVVMNIQAVIVEEESGRPMMSGFHGLFSVGGIIGAGSLTGMMSLGIDPKICQVGIAFALLLMIVAASPSMVGHHPTIHPAERSFVFPRGKVLLLGVLALILFMAEGSVADWSGVLLTKFRGVQPAQAGLGYVAFSAMMTLNRLTGDFVIHRLGRRSVMLTGSLVGGLGFVVAAFTPFWLGSLVGFAMVGIGLSNVVPILFSETGKQDVMPGSVALSSVSTMGYVGLLAGPPMLGFIARGSSLLVSLSVLAVLCVGVAATTKLATE
ncbi:MAG: MFS transporter [Armatimonadetes bacterium]|nr:MFS transporter [Armatimonadota bacterium]